MAINGSTNGHSAAPKITLYTNHGCPYAHRAQITLKELNLPFEEVIIDLDTPRPDWYLKINPRGLVPAMKYSDASLPEETLYESGVVAQFLADSTPSHLQPPAPSSAKASIVRARQQFFHETYSSKVQPSMMAILPVKTAEAAEAEVAKAVAVVEKEIEPLLRDAAPFFGGSANFTMAEVMTAPFVIRMWKLSEAGALPVSLQRGLSALPNFSRWAEAVMARQSVLYAWDEQKIIDTLQQRVAKMRAAAA